jgi:two-component system cell cycle response regulator
MPEEVHGGHAGSDEHTSGARAPEEPPSRSASPSRSAQGGSAAPEGADETWRPTLPAMLATPPTGFRATLETPRALVLPVPEHGTMGTLTVLHGFDAGRIFSLDCETTIGRAPSCGVWIDDSTVSRVHARVLRPEPGRYTVEDLGSTNGTYIGERRVDRAELVQGVRLQIGPQVVLRFALVDPSDEIAQRDLFLAATRDPLTGVFNRRYFEERLRVELARARRATSPLTLLLLDVDDLKGINDELGHLAGDRVLRAVGAHLGAFVRCEDVLARWGGDEFVLLAPATDRAHAAILAERLRGSTSALAIAGAGAELRVTISLGLATLDEVAVDAGASDLIAQADARLYGAKRAGKNRVLGAG